MIIYAFVDYADADHSKIWTVLSRAIRSDFTLINVLLPSLHRQCNAGHRGLESSLVICLLFSTKEDLLLHFPLDVHLAVKVLVCFWSCSCRLSKWSTEDQENPKIARANVMEPSLFVKVYCLSMWSYAFL